MRNSKASISFVTLEELQYAQHSPRPDSTVAVVHIGPSRPRWLKSSLEGLHNSGYSPVLVTDDPQWSRRHPRWLRTILVAKRQVEASEFRGGFWSLATERFRALAEAHQLIGGPLLHIETDVRLAPGLDIATVAASTRSVAYPLLASGRGSGATVYLKDPGASRHLADSLTRYRTSDGLNDMEGLWRFWIDNPSVVSILPCTEGPDDERLEAVVGRTWTCEAAKLREALRGIFDAASYGQFLFGTDGRNSRYGWRISGVVDASHFAQPRGNRFDSPLKWPFQLCESTSLISLHVHSKSPRVLEAQSPHLMLHLPLDEERRHLDTWAMRSNAAEAVRRRARLFRSRVASW